MKLIKEKSREYKGQAYYKFRINLPWKVVSDAKIKVGDDLEAESFEDKIVIKKKKSIESQ